MLTFDGGDPLRFLRLAARQGGVVPLRWDDCPVFFLNDPSDVADTLLVRQKNFVRSGGPARLSRLLGNGLLRSQGAVHLRQRRMTQPAFHPKWLAAYGQTMAEETRARFSGARSGATVDFHRAMTQITLSVVGKTFFSLDLSKEVAAIGESVSVAIRTLPPARRKMREWLRRKRFHRACSSLDRVIQNAIARRREAGLEQIDLLTALMASRDTEGDGGRMNDTELRDELMTLLIAGHETTASALTWAAYLLAVKPKTQDRLYEEVSRVTEGKLPTVADVPRLVYTRGVFAEALRLYPPAWILFRRAVDDCEIRGNKIARGAHLAASGYTMGRDERYFETPEEFLPERWTPEREAMLPEGAYFPFGLGNRRCLGEQFAWNEAILVLAALVQENRLRLSPRARVEESPLFTLRPKYGMPLIVHRRSSND